MNGTVKKPPTVRQLIRPARQGPIRQLFVASKPNGRRPREVCENLLQR